MCFANCKLPLIRSRYDCGMRVHATHKFRAFFGTEMSGWNKVASLRFHDAMNRNVRHLRFDPVWWHQCDIIRCWNKALSLNFFFSFPFSISTFVRNAYLMKAFSSIYRYEISHEPEQLTNGCVEHASYMRFIRIDLDNQPLTFHLKQLPFNLPKTHFSPHTLSCEEHLRIFYLSKLIQIKQHKKAIHNRIC